MDVYAEHEAELRAMLKAQRDELRAFSKTVVGWVTALKAPETALEADRIARAVTSADRMLCHLLAPPPEPRKARPGPDTDEEVEEDEDDGEEEKDEAYYRARFEAKTSDTIHRISRLAVSLRNEIWTDRGYDEADQQALEPLWDVYYQAYLNTCREARAEGREPPEVLHPSEIEAFAPGFKPGDSLRPP